MFACIRVFCLPVCATLRCSLPNSLFRLKSEIKCGIQALVTAFLHASLIKCLDDIPDDSAKRTR